jgi:uncharacterized membrane protein YeaQ/YmgE (transglycosylase-associated protein family)
MNYVFAIVIGAVIGAAGGFLLRRKQANAIWLAPVLSIVGAVLASVLATLLGDPGYGIKEAGLQVVLAAVGVGIVYALSARGQAPASS